MTTINWKPSPREMRQWALLMAPALGLVGGLFYFVDWAMFSGGEGFAKLLWSFGAFAFLTGITGTKLGLPAYWAWMGFVFVVSWLVTHVSLALVYFLVVTPLGLVGRLIGRDKLQLRARHRKTYWYSLADLPAGNPERQF
jgi:hypothetical protein